MYTLINIFNLFLYFLMFVLINSLLLFRRIKQTTPLLCNIQTFFLPFS